MRVKRNVDSLAIFGGATLFSSVKGVGELAMPDVEDYLRMLKRALGASSLTNNGAYARELERRLAMLHDVRHCFAFANAALGIIMLMRIFAGGRRGEVVMPAFSYRGLPHFAHWAGQTPCFGDVEEETHGLDPRTLSEIVHERTTSILAVNNANGACAIEELSEEAERLRVPLFYDSVYGVASTYDGRPLGGFGRAEVFSLHATKLLNGFEGGYATTNDDALAAALRALRDNGTTNTYLNEMHAAMALLSLDDLDGLIERNRARYESYKRILAQIPGLRFVDHHDAGEKYNFELVIVEALTTWPLTRDETVGLLRAEGAAIVAYYSPPLHDSGNTFESVRATNLPVAESLAKRFFQLPVGELVSLSDIERIGEYLEFVAASGGEIAARLRAAR